MEIELGSSVFYNDELYKEENQHQENILLQIQLEDIESKQKVDQEGLWLVHFDGAMSRVSVGAGAWISSPT